MAQRNPSKITTDYAVDDPLVQGSVFEFDADDRQYIDNQIRGTQQRVVDLHALGSGSSTPWHRVPRASKAVNYTIVASDFLIVCTAAITVSLPVAPTDGDTYQVSNLATTPSTLNGGLRNVGAGTTLQLAQYQSVTVTYDAAENIWIPT